MGDAKKTNYLIIIKTVILGLVVSFLAILIFAIAMYFLEGGYKYSPLFATLSIAVGCFISSLYLGGVLAKKGILIGLSVGGTVFIVMTLITLIVNSGAVSMHILLRLIILLLSSIIGGIIGVNRKLSQKYI